MHSAIPATDLDLTSKDIIDLTSPDAVAAFLSKLRYDTRSRKALTAEAIGLTGESAAAIRKIELLSEDPEHCLQVVFAQSRTLTARVRNDLVRVLGKSTTDHLLVLTADFDILEFVLLDKRKRERKGPAPGDRIQVIPRAISIQRRHPTQLDLRFLRRLTWTCADGLEQFSKLRSVFEAAACTGEYFQNRGLFADYYLRDRLRDDAAWRDDPSEMFLAVRDLLGQSPGHWAGLEKDALRKQLLEPLFKRLGFKPAVNRPGKTDQAQPDYLLKGTDGAPLSAAFVYSWDRSLDGPDLNDADTPEENPGACAVTALDNGPAAWIVVTNGRLWRLYSRQAHARATNFYEVDLVEALAASGDTDPNEAFRYWWLFFRPEAFRPGTADQGCWLDAVLQGSRDYARRLGERLKDRVFLTIFPHLAQGFLKDRRQRLGHDTDPGESELADTFEATLTLLYRLLFLLYAESRDLLPVREAPYQAASFKKIKEEIADKAGIADSEVHERLEQACSPRDTALYDRLTRLFQAMDRGDAALNVPIYNGGLFNTAPEQTGQREQAARFLLEHKVPDRYLALAIDRLARDQDERRLDLVFIDYKSLEVRHLGSIYEGLLEFKLRLAEEDLTTQADKKGEKYLPLSKAQASRKRQRPEVVVERGQVYLSNDKAERKASGSYYTPDPIVEYIVAHTVGPVLDEKLESLRAEFQKVRKTFDNELDKSRGFPTPEVRKGQVDHRKWAAAKTHAAHKELVEELFDFKVLDPAMGSGHFLVEAVELITDRLLKFLTDFPINPVNFALDRTRSRILESLGEQGVAVDSGKLTDINLLKRHVLKRCIYGVDLNPMAVELAKVSLWLDCFTLGAPLNFLDHHLRCGNSLIGATFKDLESATATLFGLNYQPMIRAIDNVVKLSAYADATSAEVSMSQRLHAEALKQLSGYKIILDLLAARHFGFPKAAALVEQGRELDVNNRERFLESLQNDEERKLVEQVEALARRPDLRFFHWDIEFPEVFFGFIDADRRQIKHKDKIAEGSAGFDCVVGNPPYVRTERLESTSKAYFAFVHPNVHDGKADIYYYFLSVAHGHTRTGGRFGLIVANAWLQTNSGKPMRRWLPDRASHLEIIDFETIRPFEDADMRPAIVVAQSNPGKKEPHFVFSAPRANPDLVLGPWRFTSIRVSTNGLMDSADLGWSIDRLSSPISSQLTSCTAFRRLEEVVSRIYSGIKPGATEAFVIPGEDARSWIGQNPDISQLVKPFFRGQDLHAYSFDTPKEYILLVTNEEEFRRFAVVKKHLGLHQPVLEQRDEVRRGSTAWFALRPCDYYDVFSEPIIAWPDTAKSSRFCWLPKNSVIGNTAFCIKAEGLWLLPILNSSVGWRLISLICQSRDERAGQLRYRLLPQSMANFPIPDPAEPIKQELESVANGQSKHTSKTDEIIADLYLPLGLPREETPRTSDESNLR